MLMWCSVGWWIVPWPRQPELEHWIQVLRNLGTSMLANLFKLLSGFQEQAELQLFHHMPLLEFTEDQVWLQRRDHSLEQEGEWLPFGAACSYPRVEWLGNRIIEKGKSSYTSGLASGSPLVTDIWFLTNREPKSLHFPPTPAFRPPASLSVYRDQQGRHIRIWGLGFFLKKNATSRQPDSIFCYDVIPLFFSKDLPFYSNMYAFVYTWSLLLQENPEESAGMVVWSRRGRRLLSPVISLTVHMGSAHDEIQGWVPICGGCSQSLRPAFTCKKLPWTSPSCLWVRTSGRGWLHIPLQGATRSGSAIWGAANSTELPHLNLCFSSVGSTNPWYYSSCYVR